MELSSGPVKKYECHRPTLKLVKVSKGGTAGYRKILIIIIKRAILATTTTVTTTKTRKTTKKANKKK